MWSGASLFGGYNVKDFKVSNVDGVDMLTGIYNKGQYDVILNDGYGIHKMLHVEAGSGTNIHAFTTADRGTRSLAMTEDTFVASSDDLQSIGYTDTCRIHSAGFEERDTKTWQLIFEWFADEHIHYNETFLDVDCRGVWDYL